MVEVGAKRVWERKREREERKKGRDVHIWSCSMALSLGGQLRTHGPLRIYWKEEAGGEVTAQRKGQRKSSGDVTVSYSTYPVQEVQLKLTFQVCIKTSITLFSTPYLKLVFVTASDTYHRKPDLSLTVYKQLKILPSHFYKRSVNPQKNTGFIILTKTLDAKTNNKTCI